ncbi:MAG TPA: 4-amino-4-deoxy-L-arabinose transferase [Nocardioidaceae bacterium]
MSDGARRAADIADLLVLHTFALPATLGAGRLVCLDGPAGSGKTTLADAVVQAVPEGRSVCLVHMDDVYEGWEGLAGAPPRLARDLVEPLSRGEPGRYRRYDWHRGRLAEWHRVDPVDLLVLEGVGSGSAEWGGQITTLVWVEAPRDLRIARGVARDGEQVLPRWHAWMRDEEAHFARDRTRDRADVLVDGSGAEDNAVVFA